MEGENEQERYLSQTFCRKKNAYIVESEIRLLDGETCLSKIVICHNCWSEINSKFFFPKVIVFLGSSSYRSLV